MMDNGSRSGSVKQNRKPNAPLLSPKSVLGEDEGHLGSLNDLQLDIYFNDSPKNDEK